MILRLNVRFAAILLALLCLAPCGALSAGLTPLPMNQFMAGPVPKNVNYRKSNTFYQDDSISVKISAGTYQGVRYTTARVKIAHASQLRAVSAQQVRNPRAGFGDSTYNTATGAQIAQAVNAVVGINGDYFITDDKCQVMMRQCKQIRNRADGRFDVLIVDKNGDFSAIRKCTASDYKAYYKKNSKNMYQAFCFGPVLVQDGEHTIGGKYENRDIIARKKTQRAAIAQIGPLEYMLIVSDGDSVAYTEGLTVMEFSLLCEKLGKQASKTGFQLAYNLDGGNSAAIIYKKWTKGKLEYKKLNMVNRGRLLSDMICFYTLVR